MTLPGVQKRKSRYFVSAIWMFFLTVAISYSEESSILKSMPLSPPTYFHSAFFNSTPRALPWTFISDKDK